MSVNHLRILDSKKIPIYSELDPGCDECLGSIASESETVAGPVKRRRGRVTTPLGCVEFCTSNADLVASSGLFKKELRFFAAMIGRIQDVAEALEKAKKAEVKRLTHNLTSINGHLIQGLYALVPQDELSKGAQSQIKQIAATIAANPNEAAQTFLVLLKDVMAMKTDLSVFAKLQGGMFETKFLYHNIHKVITNSAAIFYQEFYEKNVTLDVESCYERIYLDYESFSVALFHFLQNAVKYTERDSKFSVRFIDSDDLMKISFAMRSLKIEEDEVIEVLRDPVRGKAAQESDIPGDGYGLSAIVRLIALSKGSFHIFAGKSDKDPFADNEFQIWLPKRKRK